MPGRCFRHSRTRPQDLLAALVGLGAELVPGARTAHQSSGRRPRPPPAGPGGAPPALMVFGRQGLRKVARPVAPDQLGQAGHRQSRCHRAPAPRAAARAGDFGGVCPRCPRSHRTDPAPRRAWPRAAAEDLSPDGAHVGQLARGLGVARGLRQIHAPALGHGQGQRVQIAYTMGDLFRCTLFKGSRVTPSGRSAWRVNRRWRISSGCKVAQDRSPGPRPAARSCSSGGWPAATSRPSSRARPQTCPRHAKGRAVCAVAGRRSSAATRSFLCSDRAKSNSAGLCWRTSRAEQSLPARPTAHRAQPHAPGRWPSSDAPA